MWLGAGGWLALVLTSWGGAWAVWGIGARPVRTWIGTAVALFGMAWCTALASVHLRLLIGVSTAARAVTSEGSATQLVQLGEAYQPLYPAVLGTLVGLGVLFASRREAVVVATLPGRWWALPLGTVALPALLSLAFLGWVDLAVFTVDPGAVRGAIGRAAVPMIRLGLVCAWLGIAGGLGWGAVRLFRRLWGTSGRFEASQV